MVEEETGHIGNQTAALYGCCTPSRQHNWYTHIAVCEFERCVATELMLVHSNGTARHEMVAVTDVAPMTPRPSGSPGAAVCLNRLDRTYALREVEKLSSWLSHYVSIGVRRFSLYSINGAAEVLTLASLRTAEEATVVEVVDLSSIHEYPGWYHHHVLSIRDCYARSAAAGARWAIFVSSDEYLIVPPNWLDSAAFDHQVALSFGSRPLCAPSPAFGADVGGACVPGWSGWRKYALRTWQHSTPALDPPHYVHAHPRELMLSTASGMYIYHMNDNNGTCQFGPPSGVAPRIGTRPDTLLAADAPRAASFLWPQSHDARPSEVLSQASCEHRRFSYPLPESQLAALN